ncbi:MAG: hypothetical protein II978_07530 [Clostridia bacterium]|nr:hypothetical protein [Clostridia bacterium]
MIKITRYLYIHFLTIPLFVLAYFVKAHHTMLMAYAIVTVHELFHLFAALILKIRIGSIIVMPFGMTLRLSGSVIKNPLKESIVALAGPFSNLLMIAIGAVLNLFYICAEESMFLYMNLNFIIMAINLMPVLPLDGGRVFRSILAHFLGYITAMQIIRKITVCIVFFLVLLSIILTAFIGINVSFIMIAAFLIFNLIEEKKTSDLFVLKELLRSKEKLMDKKLIPSKVISASCDAYAKNILKKISYDNFCLIYVDNGNLSGHLVSESELIEAITTRGYRLKMGQI